MSVTSAIKNGKYAVAPSRSHRERVSGVSTGPDDYFREIIPFSGLRGIDAWQRNELKAVGAR